MPIGSWCPTGRAPPGSRPSRAKLCEAPAPHAGAGRALGNSGTGRSGVVCPANGSAPAARSGPPLRRQRGPRARHIRSHRAQHESEDEAVPARDVRLRRAHQGPASGTVRSRPLAPPAAHRLRLCPLGPADGPAPARGRRPGRRARPVRPRGGDAREIHLACHGAQPPHRRGRNRDLAGHRLRVRARRGPDRSARQDRARLLLHDPVHGAPADHRPELDPALRSIESTAQGDRDRAGARHAAPALLPRRDHAASRHPARPARVPRSARRPSLDAARDGRGGAGVRNRQPAGARRHRAAADGAGAGGRNRPRVRVRHRELRDLRDARDPEQLRDAARAHLPAALGIRAVHHLRGRGALHPGRRHRVRRGARAGVDAQASRLPHRWSPVPVARVHPRSMASARGVRLLGDHRPHPGRTARGARSDLPGLLLRGSTRPPDRYPRGLSGGHVPPDGDTARLHQFVLPRHRCGGAAARGRHPACILHHVAALAGARGVEPRRGTALRTARGGARHRLHPDVSQTPAGARHQPLRDHLDHLRRLPRALSHPCATPGHRGVRAGRPRPRAGGADLRRPFPVPAAHGRRAGGASHGRDGRHPRLHDRIQRADGLRLLWSSGTETLGVLVFNLDDGGYTVLAAAVAVLAVFAILGLMGTVEALAHRLPKGVVPWRD